MKKRLSVLVLFLAISSIFNAQEYFIRKNGKDTIPASNMEYTTNMQGFITDLTYNDKNGKKVILEGKKKLKDVTVLHYRNGTVQRMPLKISKPDGYCRYGERKVDGKLKLCVFDSRHQTSSWVTQPFDRSADPKYQTSTSGTYLLYVLMPNGTFLNASKSGVMKKTIKPYLLKCKEFEQQYKGKFSTEETMVAEMIRLYNSVCKK